MVQLLLQCSVVWQNASGYREVGDISEEAEPKLHVKISNQSE